MGFALIRALLRAPMQEWRSARWGGPLAHRIAAEWVRPPDLQSGDRACAFVALARSGALLPHAIDHARAWHDAGFKVVVVVVVDRLDDPVDLTSLEFAHAVMLRINRGYDFGAWAAVVRSLKWQVRELAVLAIANDSVLGPSAHFAAAVERALAVDADLIGFVGSTQVRPHLQSFTLVFRSGALRSNAFRRFWQSVRSGNRSYVIEHYELTLLARMEAAGLRATVLFQPAEPSDGNPTLTRWHDLLDFGFPYLKVELLRDNPFATPLDGWREAAALAGFDLAALDRQIAALEPYSKAQWRAASPMIQV